MKKSIICIFVILMVSTFVLMSAYSQEDMTVVDNSTFDNPQRSPSLFNHDQHNEAAGIEACNECHHIYEDGKRTEESSEDQSCSDCHGMDASENTPALTKAFHMNCKGCHARLAKGPVMCGECHVK